MKRLILLDTHPMYVMEIVKSEMKVSSIDEVIDHFKENLEDVFITVFDHYAHTIKNIEILAFRPKSITICETKKSFVLQFLETPRPKVNAWMQSWIKELQI